MHSSVEHEQVLLPVGLVISYHDTVLLSFVIVDPLLNVA